MSGWSWSKLNAPLLYCLLYFCFRCSQIHSQYTCTLFLFSDVGCWFCYQMIHHVTVSVTQPCELMWSHGCFLSLVSDSQEKYYISCFIKVSKCFEYWLAVEMVWRFWLASFLLRKLPAGSMVVGSPWPLLAPLFVCYICEWIFIDMLQSKHIDEAQDCSSHREHTRLG